MILWLVLGLLLDLSECQVGPFKTFGVEEIKLFLEPQGLDWLRHEGAQLRAVRFRDLRKGDRFECDHPQRRGIVCQVRKDAYIGRIKGRAIWIVETR
jgi:hypothetical protein